MIRVIKIAMKNAFGLVDSPKPTWFSKKPQIRKVTLPDLYILIQTVSETVEFEFIKQGQGKKATHKIIISRSEIKDEYIHVLEMRLREAYNEISLKTGCKTLGELGL